MGIFFFWLNKIWSKSYLTILFTMLYLYTLLYPYCAIYDYLKIYLHMFSNFLDVKCISYFNFKICLVNTSVFTKLINTLFQRTFLNMVFFNLFVISKTGKQKGKIPPKLLFIRK